MKRLFTLSIAMLLVGSLVAQETTRAGNVTVTEDENKTVVKVGDEGIIVVEDLQDTTRIKLGNKGVTIIEDDSGTKVDWSDLDDKEGDDDNGDEPKKKSTKFKPHWAGFEIGINNYVNSDFKMDLAPENSFMDLNTGRSWNFNLNFIEYGIGLGTDKVGLVTGMGVEWNNYHFDNGNVITKDDNRYIVGLDPPENASVQKAKLQTTYLTAPLLLEFQIPAGKKRVHISGGVVGGLKIGSKTKMIYTVNGNKQKDKVKDDFNLNSLRYGFTARVGYKFLKLHATYYPISLFESGKGPELYPFQVGLTLVSF